VWNGSLIEGEDVIPVSLGDPLLGVNADPPRVDHADSDDGLNVALGVDDSGARGEVLGLDRVRHTSTIPRPRGRSQGKIGLGSD